MLVRALTLFTLFLWQLAAGAHTDARTLVFDKRPLNIVLPVGAETLLMFEEAVTFNHPAPNETLTTDHIDAHVLNDTVYLTAKHRFAPTRVYVTLSSSHQVIVLNLSARKQSQQYDVLHITTGKTHPSPTADPRSGAAPVTLMRFGIQQLYAPKRLIPQADDIHRIPMRTQRTTPWLMRQPHLSIRPLISWQRRPYTLTAVTLTNQSAQPLALSEATVCGDFNLAAFFPRRTLAPAGQRDDHTTLWLIAQQPFAIATQDCYEQV